MTVKRLGRRLLIFVVVLAFMAGVGFWALRNVGRWLVAPDALQHAQAIVVLSGRTPYRAMEAAEIYRQGWAPEVWLLRDQTDEGDEILSKLGIAHPSEQEYDRQVMEKLGVPKEAIRLLESPTSNTVSEIQLIAEELRRKGGDKVILVTSPVHTRRTRIIWRKVVGSHPQAIVRAAASEPSDPAHWWRATQDVEAVFHEILGLINTYLGFVAKPRK
jgi:uncharacterized SAM-binding protein YcdF (DUF218 family)